MVRRRRPALSLMDRKPPPPSFWKGIREVEERGLLPTTVVSSFKIPTHRTSMSPEALRSLRRFQYVVPAEHRSSTRRFSYYATASYEDGRAPLCGVILCREPLGFSDVLFCKKCKPKVEEYLRGMLDLLTFVPMEQVKPSDYLLPYFGVNTWDSPIQIRIKEGRGGKTDARLYQSGRRTSHPGYGQRGDRAEGAGGGGEELSGVEGEGPHVEGIRGDGG